MTFGLGGDPLFQQLDDSDREHEEYYVDADGVKRKGAYPHEKYNDMLGYVIDFDIKDVVRLNHRDVIRLTARNTILNENLKARAEDDSER